MKSQTSLLLLLLAASGASAQRPEELPPASAGQAASPPVTPPQGSSQLRPGEARFDRVGRAALVDGDGVFALSGELAAGSFAEVTALDTGRTILVQVRDAASGLIALSGGAASQLGVTAAAPVRVRRVTVTPQDSALLSAGQAAPMRADAPQALLVGLRRMLAEQAPTVATPAPEKPRSVPAQTARSASLSLPGKESPKVQPARAQPAPKAVAPARGNLVVQIAALSNLERARALAGQFGGTVRSAGNLHRVQLGPFADKAAAERARADAAKRGYGDARILSTP